MKKLLCILAAFLLVCCSKKSEAETSSESLENSLEKIESKGEVSENSNTSSEEITALLSSMPRVRFVFINDDIILDYSDKTLIRLTNGEKSIIAALPPELDISSNRYSITDKYQDIFESVSIINEMYGRLWENSMLRQEKQTFITDALEEFFYCEESRYFYMEKIFPFITISNWEEGKRPEYRWKDRDSVTQEGYISLERSAKSAERIISWYEDGKEQSAPIDLVMPKELDKSSEKYQQFAEAILLINGMWREVWGGSMLWGEKNSFVTNSLISFFSRQDSRYFEKIEKIFPFVTAARSYDGITAVYSWSDRDTGHYQGFNSIIKCVFQGAVIVERFDDTIEYDRVTKLKNSVYLLSGETYEGHGVGQYGFRAVAIKKNEIQPYPAFNGEPYLFCSIDGLRGFRLKLWGSYDRLVGCTLDGSNGSVKIEYTKIIVSDEIKSKDAKGEIDDPYFSLEDEDFILQPVVFTFDGTAFTGNYEQLYARSRLDALIDNLEEMGLSKERDSFNE